MLLKKTHSIWAIVLASGLVACSSNKADVASNSDEGGDRTPAAAGTAAVRTVQEFALASGDSELAGWLGKIFAKSGAKSADQDAAASLKIAQSMKLAISASPNSGPGSIAEFSEVQGGKTLKQLLGMTAKEFDQKPAMLQDLKVLLLKWKALNIDSCAACKGLPKDQKAAIANITRSLTSGKGLTADQAKNFAIGMEVSLGTGKDVMSATKMQTVVQGLLRKDVFNGEKAETALTTVSNIAQFFGKDVEPNNVVKLVHEWDGDGMSGLNEVLASAKKEMTDDASLGRNDALVRALKKKGVKDDEIQKYLACMKI